MSPCRLSKFELARIPALQEKLSNYASAPYKFSVIFVIQSSGYPDRLAYSTVTDFAKFLGLSTSVPRASAVWYASSCSAATCRIGDSRP